MHPATIRAIHRYPVKGLSAEPYQRVTLRSGQTLPNDRRYAVENGPSGFDPAAPAWLAKIHFLMLMRNERLAALRSSFNDLTHTLTIAAPGGETVVADLETADGRATVERFLAAWCADDLKGPPRVLTAPPHSFSDVARKVVSIINLSSAAAIEDLVGRPVDPLRFRGNLHVAGWPAWAEFDLVGRTIAIGAARARVVKRIVRCAAVNVDPVTAERDLDIPAAMQSALGHADCGIYAEIIADGEIAIGDSVVETEPSLV
jgi:uncharacterized protein YcbX